MRPSTPLKRRAGQVGERLGRERLVPMFTTLGDKAPARGISIYVPPFLDRSVFYREPGFRVGDSPGGPPRRLCRERTDA